MNVTNFRLQREAERQAVNFPIQGTEADIMKKAMIEIGRFLDQRRAGDDVRLLLQIHDELVFEMRRERIDEFATEIKALMERSWQSAVPMRVAVKQGANWGQLE